MMPLTIGLTGMDSATEGALQAAFRAANAQAGGRWSLVGESQAAVVVVDMDSMYGPMSWLKLHTAGKTVIGLTSAPRSQADLHLPKPATADALGELMRGLAARHPADDAAPVPRPLEAPLPQAAAAVVAPVVPAAPAAARPEAPAPAAVRVEPAAAPPAPAPAPPITPARAAPPAPMPRPVPAADSPRPLAAWFDAGLRGRVRLRQAGPPLLIDFNQRQYHAGTALKPLAPLFVTRFDRTQFEPVDDATWAADAQALGDAQPLTRLVWFAGLLAGDGVLPADYDAEQKFRLTKWPQTEREYPKHFRIATVMMKGPATFAEIVEASGVARSEVADFINANLATGYAEPVRDPEPAPEPAKSGLLGRLRGR